MNFKYVEQLAFESKTGIISSKEKLLEEFRPFIINFASKTFIYGFEMQDIQNECYITLLKCIKMYNPIKHQFVGYAIRAIKNSIFYILRKSKNRSSAEGSEALTANGDLEYLNLSTKDELDETIFKKCDTLEMKDALSKLSHDEREFIQIVVFQKNTIKDYSKLKKISYSTALYKKDKIFKKLTNYINLYYKKIR